VFLLLYNKDEPYFLAIQKSDNDGYPWRNQVALPGGHIEKYDASPVDAAYREVQEEVNIPRSQIELIGSIGHYQTINDRDIQVFVGLWNGQGPVRYESAEISRVLEIPVRTILQTHISNHYHDRIPDVSELTYPFQDVVIWGVTARILHQFIELTFPLL
jgi:8-oxo-dGTP pyrophosphatase MutT (NUDIX family)